MVRSHPASSVPPPLPRLPSATALRSPRPSYSSCFSPPHSAPPPLPLHKVFTDAGIPEHGPLLITCGSAGEASLLALALDVVGRVSAVQSTGVRRMLSHTPSHTDATDGATGTCQIQAACEQRAGGAHRRLTVTAADGACFSDAVCASDEITAAWFDAWKDRLDDWFGGLPGAEKSALGHCLGALGLHLGSRFDSALNSWRVLLGKPPMAPPTSGAGATEPGCEWLSEGARVPMPEFPPFPSAGPDAFKAPVLPIPALLPQIQRDFFMQQSRLALPGGVAAAPSPAATALIGAAAGTGGALVAFGIFALGRGVRRRAGGRVSISKQ